METPTRADPEIEIRQDFEREDREDSRSQSWSLLAALVVHALLLTSALPAAEEEPLLEGETRELELHLPPRIEKTLHAKDLGVIPRLTHCVQPQWIEIARRFCIRGVVILEITIREDGAVKDPKILKTLPIGLEEVAVEAVVGWRYEPIQVDGKPMALRHLVIVQFRSGESSCPSEPIHVSSPTGSPTRPAREVRR